MNLLRRLHRRDPNGKQACSIKCRLLRVATHVRMHYGAAKNHLIQVGIARAVYQAFACCAIGSSE